MMRSKAFVLLALAAGLLIIAGPTFAHHAQSMYDRDHPVTFSGTVSEYNFTNPHVQIVFAAEGEKSASASWLAETDPPQRLYRMGWTKNSLKPGDHIMITGAPFKDGQHKMNVIKLTGPDGKELNLGEE